MQDFSLLFSIFFEFFLSSEQVLVGEITKLRVAQGQVGRGKGS